MCTAAAALEQANERRARNGSGLAVCGRLRRSATPDVPTARLSEVCAVGGVAGAVVVDELDEGVVVLAAVVAAGCCELESFSRSSPETG